MLPPALRAGRSRGEQTPGSCVPHILTRSLLPFSAASPHHRSRATALCEKPPKRKWRLTSPVITVSRHGWRGPTGGGGVQDPRSKRQDPVRRSPGDVQDPVRRSPGDVQDPVRRSPGDVQDPVRRSPRGGGSPARLGHPCVLVTGRWPCRATEH